MAENVPPGHEVPDHDPRRKSPHPDPNALVQGLEQLRDHIAERLERLETMALDRANHASAGPANELEAAGSSNGSVSTSRPRAGWPPRPSSTNRTGARHWNSSRPTASCSPRPGSGSRHERIETMAASQAGHGNGRHGLGPGSSVTVAVPANGRPAASERPAHPTPHASPEHDDPIGNDIAHSILKQFHALREDVRRNAHRRGPL